MDAIIRLSQTDIWMLIISLFAMLAAIKYSTDLIEWFVKKFGLETKKMRHEREEHELLVATATELKELAKRHQKDNEMIDKIIDKHLIEFYQPYREQSLSIQKELKNSIVDINNSDKRRDEEVKALMCGTKELLGDKIDQKYEKYVNLDGVPENEIEEFRSIYEAYRGLNGNHGRERKYKYVTENLKIIPVETKLKL